METRIDYHIMNTAEQTSHELAQIAIELLEIQEGESVADLCCCEGYFLHEVAKRFNKVKLYGSDLNIHCCTKAQDKIAETDASFKIEFKNMFNLNSQQKFDKILVHPPFGMASKGDPYAIQFFHGQFDDAKAVSNPSFELMCIRLARLLIAETGKAVVFAPLSTTHRPSDKFLRQSIVEDGSLKSVVSLPSGTFGYTAIQGVAYVVEKNIGGIEFVNGKDSRIVSKQEVKNHRFDLNPTTYLLKPITLKNPTHLGDVCSEILRSNLAKSNENRACIIGNRDIYSVKIANMEDGLVSLEKATEEELPRAMNGIRLKKEDVLLSRVTSPVNAAIYEHESDVEAYAHNNIYILRADITKVDPYYLCAFFNSNLGAEVLRRKGLGSHMPVISIKDLRELEIPLPSLEEQQEVAEQFNERCERIKQLKEELKDERRKVTNVLHPSNDPHTHCISTNKTDNC